jgi:hypothetical protein
MTPRILFVLVFAWAGLSGADKPAGKEDSKEKPAAAEQSAPKDGKKYVERRTPFGVVRVEDKEEPPEEPPANMRAFEEGDNVRFERPTPFGVARWVRKKSELDQMERAVVERERRKLAEKEPAKEEKREKR